MESKNLNEVYIRAHLKPNNVVWLCGGLGGN